MEWYKSYSTGQRGGNHRKKGKKKHHAHSQKSLISNGSGGIVCPSKHGISSIEDFVHIALVKGLFCLLALPMSQELRKSLIFHPICCNSSLLQLQIIPPSTAESDNLDKQPIASRLGLKPGTLKRFSPSSAFLHNWKDLTNWTQYFQDPSSCFNRRIVERRFWKSSKFTRADRQSAKGFWILISLYIFFTAKRPRQQLYLFPLFLLKKHLTKHKIGNSPLPVLTTHSKTNLYLLASSMHQSTSITKAQLSPSAKHKIQLRCPELGELLSHLSSIPDVKIEKETGQESAAERLINAAEKQERKCF